MAGPRPLATATAQAAESALDEFGDFIRELEETEADEPDGSSDDGVEKPRGGTPPAY